jgi:hypothetical protein
MGHTADARVVKFLQHFLIQSWKFPLSTNLMKLLGLEAQRGQGRLKMLGPNVVRLMGMLNGLQSWCFGFADHWKFSSLFH